MDILEFNRRFMQLEEELGLFPDTRVSPPGWWDVVRHDVMKLAFAKATGAAADPPAPVRLATRLHHLVTRWRLKVELALRSRLSHADVVVFRAPRLLRDGRLVDTAMDQVLSVCPGRTLIINTFPHRYERRFAKPSELAPRPQGLDQLEARLHEVFGLSLDLDEFVRHRLADHLMAYRHHRAFLQRVAPRLVLLTQNGVDKGLFRACRELRIPCIEVQHGLINGAHPAYAYPPSVSNDANALFPDGLLGFSEFWLNNCYYPVRWTAPVGNDEFVPPPLPPADARGDILVITAIKYNDRLCEWLDLIAPQLPRRRFLFKLHPSQAAYLPAVQGRLAHLSNVQVFSTDTTVAQLMASASDVLLIQSTVAYEAVQAGRKLVVISESDSGAHADLFSLPGVFLASTEEDIVSALEARPLIERPPVFFKPFDASLARRILADGHPVEHATSGAGLSIRERAL